MVKHSVLAVEEKRRKKLIKEFLKTASFRDGRCLKDSMKEYIAQMVSGSLENELNDEFGYNKL